MSMRQTTITMNSMLYKHSSSQRKKNRNQKFQLLRRNKTLSQQINLDYLCNYSQDMQIKIKNSLICPLPQQLPPVSPQTISLYRRSSYPIYQPYIPNTKQLDHHMLCQSLNLLAKLSESCYPNYKAIVQHFQQQLKNYLAINSKEIFEMIVAVTINKAIGRQNDIFQLVNRYKDPQGVWILINHCYLNKISYKYLQRYLISGDIQVYKLFYLYSNQKGHQAIYWIMDSQSILDSMFNYLKGNDQQLKLIIIRILGNICAQQSIQQNVTEDIKYNISLLLKYKILDHLYPLILNKNNSIRKDTYWLLYNLSIHEQSSISILRHGKLIQKCMENYQYQQNLESKKNLLYMFYFLIENSQELLVFQSFVNKNYVNMICQSLTMDDMDVVEYVFKVIKKLIELGEVYVDQNQNNVVLLMLERQLQFKNNIQKYLYSQNHQVSTLCNQIMNMKKDKDVNMQGQL